MAEIVSELGKKKVDDDINRIKEWLSKQPHLPDNIDDSILKAFLCGTKSIEIAKQKLETWLVLRGNASQLFSFQNRNPLNDKYQTSWKALKQFFLPGTTLEGYRVIMCSVGEDFSKYNYTHEVIRMSMMLDLAMVTWPDMKGIYILADFNGMDNSLTKFNPVVGATFFQWLQSSLPMKPKGFTVINAQFFSDTVVNLMIKPFLKKKLADRITITTEGSSFLVTKFPEEMIPEEYGGKALHSQQLYDYWNNMLIEKVEWFKEISSLVSDEKKRLPDKNDTYGIQGTFRALTVD